MRGLRLKCMLYLYNASSKIYADLFKRKKEAWGIPKEEFLAYPEGSLGAALGFFYQSKGFDIMPKLENHDVFHVLTATGTEIEDEIAMQYLLLGNGKLSLYLLGMVFIGTLIFPEFLTYYLRHFQKGKHMQRFHEVEFKFFLSDSLIELQTFYASKRIIFNLK